jgi:hypothetical protein
MHFISAFALSRDEVEKKGTIKRQMKQQVPNRKENKEKTYHISQTVATS